MVHQILVQSFIYEERLPASRTLGILHNVPPSRRFLCNAAHLMTYCQFRCSLSLSIALCMSRVFAAEPEKPPVPDAATQCLPSGDGYLKARLSGAIAAELNWTNAGLECVGAIRPSKNDRPTDGGIRMRFSRADAQENEKIVLVFGIAQLAEGAAARTVPVNLTVIREGKGEFYSTQGDDKCMLDEVRQTPLVGIPFKSRSYRIVARGYCTEPARAVRGQGAVLMSRFDFSGRVDFETEATEDDTVMAVQ
jgi:hypothetical protein